MRFVLALCVFVLFFSSCFVVGEGVASSFRTPFGTPSPFPTSTPTLEFFKGSSWPYGARLVTVPTLYVSGSRGWRIATPPEWEIRVLRSDVVGTTLYMPTLLYVLETKDSPAESITSAEIAGKDSTPALLLIELQSINDEKAVELPPGLVKLTIVPKWEYR